MNTAEAKEVAAKLWATVKMGTWSFEALTTWLECDCRCVYCERYMLEDREIAYFFWQCDHILPKGKYKELINAPSNWVLSCRACNTLKSDWDPNTGGESVIDASRNELTSEDRSRLIAKTRDWLAQLKIRNNEQFKIEKKAIEDCLSGLNTDLSVRN